MFFKYYSDGQMRIREFRDLVAVENGGKFDPPVAIVGLDAMVPAVIAEESVQSLVSYLKGDMRYLDRDHSVVKSNAHIVENLQSIGEAAHFEYEDSLALFRSVEAAESVMDAIADAINEGRPLFDLTVFDEDGNQREMKKG